MTDNVLELRGISAYTHNKTILKDINLSLTAGQTYGLLGHNGSGKSTLQRLIANLEVPMQGEVLIRGEVNDINQYTDQVLLIPDTVKLHFSKTIKENVAIITTNYDFDDEYFAKCLHSIDLNEQMEIRELSKGNQEMVQLMIYLCCKTSIYLLDEPFSAIDIYRRDFIQKLLIDCIYRNPNAIIVITTHLINEIQNILDHIIYIDHGDIVINDSIDNLIDDDMTLVEYLKDYFKGEVGYDKLI